MLLLQRPVPVLPAPLPCILNESACPFAHRPTFENIPAITRFCPKMGESEKVKCLSALVLF